MIAKCFEDKVILPEKKDVLRVHLYLKLIEKGVKPFENDIDIILELYSFGGYSNSEEQVKFIDICLQKGLRKSGQSLRNTLSKYVNIGVFDKPKNTILSVNEEYIPKVTCDKLLLLYSITDAN